MRLYTALVASWALFMASVTHAQNCPALLEGARRLVFVTFDSMTSSTATLRLFERRTPATLGDLSIPLNLRFWGSTAQLGALDFVTLRAPATR